MLAIVFLLLGTLASAGQAVLAGAWPWLGPLAQGAGIACLVASVRGAARAKGLPSWSLARQKGHPVWLAYLLACSLVLVSLSLRLALQSLLGTTHLYITFYPAVMLAALAGGFGPGLLATLLSVLLAQGLVFATAGQAALQAGDGVALCLFLGAGWMVAASTDRMHRALARAGDAEARAQGAVELERAQEVLRRTVAELVRSNEELERFAYVASHDLQEPLRMVNAYVGLLGSRYQGQLDGKADQYIAFAVEGAERMQGLIHDLLAYSRLGSQAHRFPLISAEDALDVALASLRSVFEASGARLVRDPLPRVAADAGQLAQVFQNLLGNALKYRSERPPLLRVGCREHHGLQTFFVKDNGIGMDPQYSQRIFEIFQRLTIRDTCAGTGMGLSICKKIVERHGGRIWVETSPGEGSTFFFTLNDATGSPA
jgi:signal transduction histidine kinase